MGTAVILLRLSRHAEEIDAVKSRQARCDTCVHFRRPLLLSPVAAAWQHDGLSQQWHRLPHVDDGLASAAKAHREVEIADHAQRRHGHMCAGKGRQ